MNGYEGGSTSWTTLPRESVYNQEYGLRKRPHNCSIFRKDRQPRNRCQTCLKHESEREQESSTRPRQSPPTAMVQRQVNQDGSAFSRKTLHSNKQRGNLISVSKSKIQERGARVQCKREASRIRRAIAADRSANDVAKQMTMTREEVMSTREGK